MSGWTLTVRVGPKVERHRFRGLDEALTAMRERLDGIRDEGPLEPIEGFRTHGPGDRVKARLELSIGSWLRGRAAGIDVMGDGRLVAHAGSVRRRPLDPGGDRGELEAVREALS